MKKKIALIVGAFLLAISITAGGTYAVFQADGDAVTTDITSKSLDIDLKGDTERVTFDNLVPGQKIKKQLSVTNTKNTSLYTRVTITKYWLNSDGEKDLSEDASNIKLQYNEKWYKADVDDASGEDLVLYYQSPVAPGATTSDFLESIQVPSNFGNIDANKKFVLEISVDAVQSIDGSNALTTQWGVQATLDGDGNITKITQ